MQPRYYVALLSAFSFALYWTSSFNLQAHQATAYFGADTRFYSLLASGDVIERLSGSYELSRIARFHPVTIALSEIWMRVVSPLTQLIAPLHLLKAMFAAIGAVGAGAATAAFYKLVPRCHAPLWGIIYATSFGVWYFASIEESKIVTASLSALYIAVYLQLRERWTMQRPVWLTAIYFLACLNEIVSGFLLVIPLIDALVRGRLRWRPMRWIIAQGVAALLALAIMEIGINGAYPTTAPESSSHLGMLLFYISNSNHTAANFHAFVLNWLFFNIVAPTSQASHAVALWPDYQAFFEPSLASYLTSPAAAGALVLFGAIVVAGLLLRPRERSIGDDTGLHWALAAFVVLRGAFFFIFDPAEPLLYSSPVTLPLMLCIGSLFMTSAFPRKVLMLAAMAVLLAIANGNFIFSALRPSTGPPKADTSLSAAPPATHAEIAVSAT